MSKDELMNGYEAACVAKNEIVLVAHPKWGTAHWEVGYGLQWEHSNARVGGTALHQTGWHVVDSDEPEPPEGCMLWPVEVTEDDIHEVQVPEKGHEWWPRCPLFRIEADVRFRGWGYVVGGELRISAYASAWTDGRCSIPIKNSDCNRLLRPDYAVMKAPEAD